MAQRSKKSRKAGTKGSARTAAATQARVAAAAAAAAAAATRAEDVTVLYSRVRHGTGGAHTTTHMLTRQPTAQSSATAARPLGSAVAETAYDAHALRLRTASTELAFWLRCVSQTHLRCAIDECDLDVIAITRGGTDGPAHGRLPSAEGDVDAMASRALFLISEDRLRVALQSLIDLKALLICFAGNEVTSLDVATSPGEETGPGAQTTPPMTALRTPHGSPHGGCGCWVRADLYDAAVALAQLSEAALPPRSPSLVARDAALLTSCDAASRLTCVGPLCADDVQCAADDQKTAVAAAADMDVCLTPSPVAYEAVMERLASVRRLWQLRYNYTLLMPALRRCSTAKELCSLLFSHSRKLTTQLRQYESSADASGANTADAAPPRSDDYLLDRLVVLPERNARHRHEQQILSGLLAKANTQCALRTEAWGPLGVRGALKVRDGVYVVHYAPRQEVLRRVLRVAELYGLPPFLRSIRRHPHGPSHATLGLSAGGHWDELGESSAVLGSVVKPQDGEQQVPSAYAPHTTLSYPYLLFFAPDILDAHNFAVPDAMQAQIVQEELIDLTVKYCGFGLLIGAADQIAFVLKSITEYKTTLWERQVARKKTATGAIDYIKREADVAEDETHSMRGTAPAAAPHETCSPLHDPMATYVRALLVAASQPGSGDGSGGNNTLTPDRMRVDWLCANRWSDEVTYYGLVYGVVLESDLDVSLAGTQVTTPLELDGRDVADGDDVDEANAAQGGSHPLRDAAYYVAAVVELRR